MPAKSLDEIVALCKRRGFLFPAADLYGGLQGVYDYGPLGIELKNHLKAAWWKANVYARDDILGLDASLLSHPLVFQHSGHTETFADLLVDCRECKKRWRVDHLVDNRCEACGSDSLTEARPFNMMFRTQMGPVPDEDSIAYLRPETAQGIFTNFKHVLDSSHMKLPFGIAQTGKAFRNEITPRHFIFRVREFEQMEIEFFVHPDEDAHWHQVWIQTRLQWWLEQGLARERLQLQEQTPEELAHYAKRTVDILYAFPHGFEELEGVANRTDYDLGSHTKNQSDLNIQAKVSSNTNSTEKLAMWDETAQRWFVPYVIEPSAGVERGILAILTEAFENETLPDGKSRIVLHLKPHLAPIKAAIVPLAKNNERLMHVARSLYRQLQTLGIGCIAFEGTGNVGKSYRRHDEIGTPWCFTVDFDTLGEENPELKNTVTIRERDSMQQSRMPIEEIPHFLAQKCR